MNTDLLSHRFCNHRGGFTFIEILIALLLVSMATLALTKLQIDIESNADDAQNSLEALQYAEAKLEWFRTRGASTPLSTVPVADFSRDLKSGETKVNNVYAMSWQVSSTELNSALKEITVEVSWLDRPGEERSIALTTLISEFSEFDQPL